MPLSRRLVLAVLAGVALSSPGAAWACSATGACPNLVASCCVGNTCTIDGTVTVTGATCNLDFGLHNVTLSGTLAVGSNTVTIRALSFAISGSGLLDAHGTSPNPGGNVVVTTTDGPVTSFAMTGSAASRIDLTGFGTGGGSLEIHASGPVSLTGGRIDASSADPNGTEDGGSILIDSTAGDLTVGISLLANSGSGGGGGSVTLDVPGNVMVNDTGRIAVFGGGLGDAGAIEITAGGTVAVTNAGLLQADGLGGSAGGGGTIDILGGTAGASVTQGIQILGTLEAQGGSDATGDAGGDGGAISLEAANGTLTLTRASGAAVSADGAGGGGDGQVNLQTDAAGADVVIGASVSSVGRGTTGNNTPGGGDVEITSAGGVTVARSIDVSGIDSTGVVNMTVARDVAIQHSIFGGGNLGGGSLTIDAGHDVDFTNVGAGTTVRMTGLGSGPGGDIEVSAGNDLTVTGYSFNATGSAAFDGGTIVLQAGRNLTVANGTSLDASAGATAPARGGEIALTAGFPDLAGDLTIAGDVTAAGNDPSGTRPATIQLAGCRVVIASTGSVDSRGDTGSLNTVIGRTSLTVNGKLRATGANTPSYPTGTPPNVTANATVQPAFPSPCPTCAKPVCTQRTPVVAPPDCLMPCPQCGDGVVTAPAEDCDPGTGGDRCVPGHECDIHCRSLPAGCPSGAACFDSHCDQIFGCVSTPSADGTVCEDGKFCTSGDTCRLGVCMGGPSTSCDDSNPCTIDAQCDRRTDTCVHTSVLCTPDPSNHCYVIPACSPATGCPAAQLVACPNPGDVCNPLDGSCGPQPCAVKSDCNDTNPCTDDVCSAGHCAYPPRPDGQSCDDATLCNGTEMCQSGVCTRGAPPNCDDAKLCTDDSCDPIQGCQNVQVPGCCVRISDCPGSNECTSCINNTCGVVADCCFTAADCDDGNPCTDDGCNMAAHQCSHVPVSDEVCGDVCNPGTCTGGTCDSTPRVCVPDNDPCTDDFCDPTSSGPDPCVHRHRDGCCQTDPDCDDQSACTRDTCDHMQCLHTEVVPDCKTCSTDQDCAPGFGPTNPGGACAGQRCQGGICTKVAPPNCDAAPPNFMGRCLLDAAGNPGCVNLCLNQLACDDHDVCNGKETCSADGSCVAGTPLDCDDHDLCTDDTCAPATGCPHPQKTGYAGVRCQLDTMDAALNAAGPTDVPAAVRRKIGGLIGKVRAKLAAGESAGQGKRALKPVTAAGKQLKAIGKAVRAAMHGKKKIDAMLGNVLAGAATGGSAAVESLKASLRTP